jgi:predicted PhzF superfamily epimerase YddE/YHI9
MRVPFRLLDVFGVDPFTGNQLCVVPDAAALDERIMQALAQPAGHTGRPRFEDRGVSGA